MYRELTFKIQQGLGLVGVVFVIVIVSLLSVAMARMVMTDQTSQSYEILALKAFLAAESGAQFGVNRLFPPTGGGSCTNRSFSFQATALRYCQANVTCVPDTVGSETYYVLTSTGECTAGSFTTERVVQVRTK